MSNLVLVQPRADGEGRLALDILRKELQARTGLCPSVAPEAPDGAFVAVGTEGELDLWQDALRALPAPGPEGYRLCVLGTEPLRAVVCGADARGCLYGCGALLRKLELLPGVIRACAELRSVSVTPRYPLRGHQLAYRDKQNTCPNWTLQDFDDYIRTLALFGVNAIEILPPRTDDRLFSPLFKTHPLQMMVDLSRVIHGYGLDVWLWYPNMARDYADPETFRAEMAEREQIFGAIPFLDAILIPAGDPGELQPRQFFQVAGRMMAVAHRFHPQAKVYVAPQSFAPEADWYDAFYREVSREPDWLYGVCYAPWVRDTLPEMAARLPEKYRTRIRHYPDITHTASCQFEVPLWDGPLSIVHGRESCCPRPRAMKAIHNLHAPYCIGSLTYSEGIHDDVNKFLWTDQDVDPDRDAQGLVRDYVRLLIDPEHVDELTDLIFALEDNWKGRLADNGAIEQVFARFERLDAALRPQVRDNYRYRMLYQRAMLDAYARRRFLSDARLEREALEELRRAPQTGADAAVRAAWAIFNRTFNEPVAEDLRFRLQELGQKLYETPGCRMQQSTSMHNAQAWIRGAWLDTLDTPLNDMQFYTCHFGRILRLHGEEEKLEAIRALLHRTDPGPGGRYVNLGDLDDFQRYVVPGKPYEQDPGMLRSPHLFHDLYGLMMRFYAGRGWAGEFPIPMRWVHRARTIYGTPLTVRVDGLEPGARYRLRVTYPDMIGQTRERLEVALYADGRLIHDAVRRDEAGPGEPVYGYDLPAPVGPDGAVTLTWQAYDTLYPTAVSELWLIRA